MRYVEGSDLRQRLARAASTPGDAAGILAQVASALDAAHARGLVHRDVKPSNVLLDPGARPDGSDHAYLADFGLTKRLSEETGAGEDGKLMGTIDVAPEQIAGEEIDCRADVYSLGCVFHECLVGEPPFRGDSDIAVVFAHLEAEPPCAERGAARAPGGARRGNRPRAGEGAGAALLERELARARLAVAVDEASRRSWTPPPAPPPAGAIWRGRGGADRQGDRRPARARAGPSPLHPRPRVRRGGHARSGPCSSRPVDSDYFFGRERLVAELVARLVGAAFLGIVGPSGSGSPPSSAPVCSGARRRVLPGGESWRRLLLRPGERPLEELRRVLVSGAGSSGQALDALPPGERLLLAVDQLEELFTACRSATERAAFAATLARAAADPAGGHS